jgi:UDP-N-acetylglucosamine--N-acetylmuramyl-(pentapeptide) pyrophosphoryl-undecaprenol N-acetylglucosamine transferase
METDLVSRSGVPFKAIPAAGLHGVGLRAIPGNLLHLTRGYLAARRILASFQPDIMLFTGGFVAVPVALAGRFRGMKRPRNLLYIPDIEPGLALKMLARFADRIAASVPDTRRYVPGRIPFTVTGYPVRTDLKTWDIQKARQVFDVKDDLPLLLVSGGSRGARTINQAVLMSLPELLEDTQIIHVTGRLDWPQVEQELASLLQSGKVEPKQANRYHPFAYLHDEMGAALTIADLVLSRAGASCLGEYPLFGLPAILVPYPYAWRYQIINARYLVERGAAVLIEDNELPKLLIPHVREIMRDTALRNRMSEAMHSLATPTAALDIAALLVAMAGEGDGKRN